MEATLVITLLGVSIAVLLIRVPQAKVVCGVIGFGVVGMTLSTSQLRAPSLDGYLHEQLPAPRYKDGYVSSNTCRSCHPDHYASWHRTFHRTMTQRAVAGNVLGDFENVILESWGRAYHLERRGNEYWAEMIDPDWDFDQHYGVLRPEQLNDEPQRVWKRVIMTTGFHHMQTYWVSSRNGRALRNLPFIWLKEDQRWVPREDAFIRSKDAGRMVPEWNSNCVKCHSTGPAPGYDLQTGTIDTEVADLGIACEACHGPGRDHILANTNPVRRYYYRRGRNLSDPTIVNPARLDAKASSQACGQCHGIYRPIDALKYATGGSPYKPGNELGATRHYLRHPESVKRTGQPLEHPVDQELLRKYFWPDGVVRVTGREYTAMTESGCYLRGELSCLSCHSMHKSPPVDQLAVGMETDEACLQCHSKYRGRIAEHTHHPVESEGSRCYNCHMPFTTYGLLKSVRNHLIDSPKAETIKEQGRPNACNLCHLDQTLQWTVEHLARMYRQSPVDGLAEEQQQVAAGVLWLLRGDAGQRAHVAWSMGWDAAREASGDDWFAPFLAHLLNDPYSAARYIAHRSLRNQHGFEQFDYDYLAPELRRGNAVLRALARWKAFDPTVPESKRPRLLMDENGELMPHRIEALKRQRDDSIEFLSE
jgi:predicted CXXCH cytochrome family protein